MRDEAQHLGKVVGELEARGGTWSKGHRNPYAQELRKAVRVGDGPDDTVDRLLVSALIEARSHDRFTALADVAGEGLDALYRGLMHAEAGHFLVFVELALAGAERVRRPRALERAHANGVGRAARTGAGPAHPQRRAMTAQRNATAIDTAPLFDAFLSFAA